MQRTKPKFAVRPAGTTGAPAYCRGKIGDIPLARERFELLTRIDWGWIRRTVAVGQAVGIAVDPADAGPLIDAVQARLGFNVVLRLTHDNTL